MMIEGYRRFNIAWTDPPVLKGSFDALWESRELVARCNESIADTKPYPGGQPYHEIWLPDGSNYRLDYFEEVAFRHLSTGRASLSSCTCGIYIAKSELELEKHGYDQFPIVAKVTGYGAYVEKEKGWQVSHCRIEHLWIDPRPWERPDVYLVDGEVISAQQKVLLKGLCVELEERYGVKCEVGFKVICKCGREDVNHAKDVWITSDHRYMMLCEMSTDHIVNAGKLLEKAYADPKRGKWLKLFREELKYRAAKRDEETGKLKVHF